MERLKRFLTMLILIVMLSSSILPTFVFADAGGYTELPRIEKNYEEDEKELHPVEKMFAVLVNGIANALNFLVSKAIGEQVTIDDLVFNYPNQPAAERWLSSD